MTGNSQQPQQDGVRVQTVDDTGKSGDALSMSIEESLNISTVQVARSKNAFH